MRAELPDDLLRCELLSSWHLVPSLGLHHPEILSLKVATFKGGRSVCNVPEYGTPNVVQATWALLLELTNRVGHHDRTVHEGRWAASADFCYWDGSLVELAGRTLGIVGYGRIGRGVAEVGRAMGMRILYHRRQTGGRPRMRRPRHALSRERCGEPPLPAHSRDAGAR